MLPESHPFKTIFMNSDPVVGPNTASIAIGDSLDLSLSSNIQDANITVYNLPSDLSLSTITSLRIPVFDISDLDPSLVSGLELWLDANHSSATSGTWEDRSAKDNDAVRTGSPSASISTHNGLPVMSYTGNGQRHKFNMINNIRTVFWVISQDSSVNGLVYLFSDTNKHPHWHNQNNGKFWSTNGWTIIILKVE